VEFSWPLGMVIGWTLSFIQQIWTRWQDRKDEVRRQEQRRKDEKWKQKQLRINTFLEKRWKTYSEALTFIYDAEGSQKNERELAAIKKKWSKWHPSNCLYLPDSVRDALNEAMKFIPAITVELGRPDGERDRGTLEKFKRKLQDVKRALTNLQEVGWLPPELEN
jgi:hypothetical protein